MADGFTTNNDHVPSLVTRSAGGASTRSGDNTSILAALGHIPAQSPVPYGGRSPSRAWVLPLAGVVLIAALVWGYARVVASSTSRVADPVATAPAVKSQRPSDAAVASGAARAAAPPTAAQAAASAVGTSLSPRIPSDAPIAATQPDAATTGQSSPPLKTELARNADPTPARLEEAAASSSNATAAATSPPPSEPSKLAQASQRETKAVSSNDPPRAAKPAKPSADASRNRATASTRSAQIKPASSQPAATTSSSVAGSDPDVDIVSALIGHGAASAGQGSNGASSADEPLTIVSLVERCRTLEPAQAWACKRRICAGYWGKAQACPASEQRRPR